MMTRVQALPFDRTSLHNLAALIGERWRLVTGDPLAEKPGHLFSWDNVVVASTAKVIRIHTELLVLDFEGYEEEYPILSVAADVGGLDAAQRDGRAFFQHQGEEIVQIHVIREVITQMMHGEQTWIFTTDYGVVFELARGAISVAKAGHHSEALDVAIADALDAVDIPDRSVEWDWDNELGEEYRVAREFIPIGTLLTET